MTAGLICSCLRRLANEVGGVVGTTDTFVLGDLWICAQRPGHVDAIVGYVICRQLIGSCIGFLPTFESGHPVDLVGTDAALAVAHAGNHEEADPVVLLLA